MSAPISNTYPSHGLGEDTMDRSHAEFVDLVNQLANADLIEFVRLFAALVAHSEAHFAYEQQLMRESSYPADAMERHLSEHLRVMRDLKSINTMVTRGSTVMARSYVRELLPKWFEKHVAVMDAELVEHVQRMNLSRSSAS